MGFVINGLKHGPFSERNCYGVNSHSLVWDCDMAAILLLSHLLPPTTKGKKYSKISASDAAGRLMKFMRVCS